MKVGFGHTVDKKHRGSKRKWPKCLRDRRLMKDRLPSFDNVAMLAFGVAVLFRGVRRGGKMSNSMADEERP